ncbi:high-affinity branched-chain amino acid transport system permease protein LivH [Desulfosporosinus acididurans]|uniref:High-affinity branched-chain amino acid transport system permease protein LivH n=1 Tax=Desulfosporosinus acididurans TaxID=476652 RepID=A0A0J1FU55_9FIRM|nr:branched-chain amino acid ABC transporter permease [Desulfosporosinus acididurans]KLU66980.1 high-affinity branched-chain amino acid transport system permease protein LivH [Desulfosporosinus acididurans]
MHSITELLQQLVYGLSLGSIYALIALGYTMVYGIVKLINFAHGDVMMVGAYMGWLAITVFHFPFFPAILFAMIVAAIAGIIIERAAYKPLRNATRIAALITAIGVSLFLEYGGMLVVGAQMRTYPNVFPETMYKIGGITFKFGDIVMLVTALVLMLLLHFTVQYTKIGKAMRASSFDMEAALLMGVNVNTTISATFAIGSALAAAAGVLYGIYFNSIDPLMGITPGLKAFVAAVLGGIGIIPGAMVGGLVLGVTESLVSGLGASTWRDAVAFLILILVLIIKPSGLFGKNLREKV